MKVYTIKQTEQFNGWLAKLDAGTRARINTRLRMVHDWGHLGDHHGLKDAPGISEMRMGFGPGYRLYYTIWEYRGQVLLLLLGGDKSTQTRDVRKAKAMLTEAKARAEREIDEALKKREEKRHEK